MWRIVSIEDGIIATWNSHHIDQQVKVGDLLLRVEGISDTAQLCEEFATGALLHLQLSRELAADSPVFAISEMYEVEVAAAACRARSGDTFGAAKYSVISQSSRKAHASKESLSLLQGKLNSGFVFLKEQVEGSRVVPTNMTEKANRSLHSVKAQAKVASTTMSAQMSQIANKSVKIARRLGRAGGA
jgi:hypothetical protein